MFKNNEAQALSKSEKTKERLYEAALKLFTRDGFDQSSMRAIAKEAGIAAGASYYHFASKENIVYEYYLRLHQDHMKVLGETLSKNGSFEEKLYLVVKTKIEVALPNKDMARALYRVAANPESPLSPFSEENKNLRLEALKVFQDVVNESKDCFNPQIKKFLPEYLWLYQMGIILFWIYDSSENSKKTFNLIDKTVPLIAYFNKQIQSPFAVPFRNKIISTLKSFAPDLGQITTPKKEGL
ncbi:MAG: TetR family transcriptional regulator [bacterium]